MADKNLTQLTELTTATDDALLYAVEGSTDYKIKKSTLLKELKGALHAISTGIIYTDGVSINADNTKFDIGVIQGYHVDRTDPENPVITYVDYAGTTAVSPTYLATDPVTYVGIDKDSVIIQSDTPFTNTQSRDYLIEFAVVHSNNTNINVINNQPHLSYGVANQLSDLMHAIGFFNVEGNIYSANGANLNLNKSIGKLFKSGANYQNNTKDPHVVSIVAETALTFRYRLQDSTEYSDATAIDPDNYDNAGTLTTVSANKFTVQKIAIFSSGITRIQYGQTLYNSMAEAVSALNTETFVIEPNIEENGLIRMALIVKQGTTDLTDLSKAKFIELDKFGAKASTGGISVSTLQSAYNNSVIPQILTSTANGALTLKRGSAADTDAVQQVQNGAGTSVHQVLGDGTIVHEKASGIGMKVDTTSPTFGWRDLKGQIIPKVGGATAPAFTAFRGTNVKNYAFAAGDKIDNITFHIPHDYVPGTDLYLHVHWGHNGTAISGSFIIDYYLQYAKGHKQALFNSEINATQTISTPDVATIPQWQHQIDEFAITNVGGDATHLDNALIEVDGLLMIALTATTIPTITGSAASNLPYIFMIDIHYQSTNMPTKQKAPNFYV